MNKITPANISDPQEGIARAEALRSPSARRTKKSRIEFPIVERI
jgi:hypothetical protein